LTNRKRQGLKNMCSYSNNMFYNYYAAGNAICWNCIAIRRIYYVRLVLYCKLIYGVINSRLLNRNILYHGFLTIFFIYIPSFYNVVVGQMSHFNPRRRSMINDGVPKTKSRLKNSNDLQVRRSMTTACLLPLVNRMIKI